MKKTGKILKIIATILMLAVIVLSIIPFSVGVVTIGSLFPMAVFGAILILWYAPGLTEKIRSTKAGRIILNAVYSLIIAGLCYCGVLAALILSATVNTPPDGNVTVVVLGCQVHGENPSQMLETRLFATLDFLEKNPETPCVVSGGRGSGENVSEAEAMKIWLVKRGIDENRIYTEEQSTSTVENLENTKTVIAEHNLPERIAVTTNEFHIYRSGLIAEKCGYEHYANPAKTPWHLFSCHFVREMFAVTKYYVLG